MIELASLSYKIIIECDEKNTIFRIICLRFYAL